MCVPFLNEREENLESHIDPLGTVNVQSKAQKLKLPSSIWAGRVVEAESGGSLTNTLT